MKSLKELYRAQFDGMSVDGFVRDDAARNFFFSPLQHFQCLLFLSFFQQLLGQLVEEAAVWTKALSKSSSTVS